MAFVVNDRVQEFTSTTGTGTLTLTGSPDGFETFSSAVGNGNTTYYTISSNTTEFEVGIGTVGAGTLSRDTVISSSNSDALVNFSAGTKNVFVTLPASKTILLNDSDTVDLTGNLDLNSNDITGTGNINITGNLTASGNLTSLGIDDNADATAVTITNQERVGIGITNPSTPLHVTKSSLTGFVSRTGSTLTLENSAALGGTEIYIASSDTSYGQIRFGDTASTYSGGIQYEHNADHMLFQINGAERMRIDSSGNVGIGTTAPDAKLSVNGVASFGDGTALLPSIANFGDLNTGMWFPAADTIAFSGGGVEAMRIISNGAVGIGTTTPDARLDIRATDSSIRLGNAAQYFRIQHNDAANALVFNDNDISERMRIDSSGNVGIGTSSPGAKLEVRGSAIFNEQGLDADFRVEGDTDANLLFVDASTDRVGIGTNVPSAKFTVIGSAVFNESGLDADFKVEGDTDANLLFVDASTDRVGIGTNVPSAKFTVIGSAVFNESGLDADFKVEGDTDVNLLFVDASTNRVGISTNTPDALLTVDGIASFGAGAAATPSIAAAGDLNTGMWFPAADTIAFSEGGTEAMRINSSGQVGIGSTNPNRTLVLDATSGSNFELKRSPNSGGLYFETDGTDGVMRSVGATGSLIFQTNGTNERMRINSSGNVGIGTTAPDAKLSVNGVASFGDGTALLPSIANFGDLNTGMWFPDADTIAFSEGGAEAMRIDSSGFVGIGLTNPAAQLHVNTNSTGRSNVYFSNFNTSGGISSQEVAIGFQFNRTGGGINLSAARVVAGKEREWVGAASNQDGFLAFETCLNESVSEKMRITSSGDVFIAKTGTAIGTVGIELDSTGSGAFTTSAVPVLYVNRLTDDGDLIRFFQASTEEGSISVSGGTVSYNGFTGTHWSRFTDNSTPNILRGTVLETLDEMCDWYNLEFDVINQDDEGNDVTTTEKVPHVLTDTQSIGDTVTYNHEGTDVQATIVKETDIKHMMSKVSDTVDAKNVYGVFVAYDNDGDGYNDFYVASVGSYVVRIKSGETLAKGDLLQSNGDGTAKVQSDDNIKSSSFAKVLSTTIIETYEDGSYLVPCSLMC
jgi:hypothetical protein